MNKVYDFLNNLNIKYKVVNHPPAMTTEVADSYIEGHEGVRTKTLFLYNKNKSRFYLVIMSDDKRLDFDIIETYFNDKKLKFSSEEMLDKKLGLKPGAVSLFGIMNNCEKDITLVFDKDIMDNQILTFHPNENIATIFLNSSDVLKFVEHLNFKYNIMGL